MVRDEPKSESSVKEGAPRTKRGDAQTPHHSVVVQDGLGQDSLGAPSNSTEAVDFGPDNLVAPSNSYKGELLTWAKDLKERWGAREGTRPVISRGPSPGTPQMFEHL